MRCLSVVILAFGGLASIADAAIIDGSATGIDNPAYTISFDEVALTPGVSQVTTQFAEHGVRFWNFAVYTPETNAYPNISGARLGNFSLSDRSLVPSRAVTISFSRSQSAAAFAMASNGGSYYIQAFLFDQRVDGFFTNIGYTSSNNFYGFAGGGRFDHIEIFNVDNQDWLIDNLQFSDLPVTNPPPPPPPPPVVPEPGSWMMLITGFALAGAVMRRRRMAATAA